jgi:hypothetical protein
MPGATAHTDCRLAGKPARKVRYGTAIGWFKTIPKIRYGRTSLPVRTAYPASKESIIYKSYQEYSPQS